MTKKSWVLEGFLKILLCFLYLVFVAMLSFAITVSVVDRFESINLILKIASIILVTSVWSGVGAVIFIFIRNIIELKRGVYYERSEKN